MSKLTSDPNFLHAVRQLQGPHLDVVLASMADERRLRVEQAIGGQVTMGREFCCGVVAGMDILLSALTNAPGNARRLADSKKEL
jgi:hypothetical protein